MTRKELIEMLLELAKGDRDKVMQNILVSQRERQQAQTQRQQAKNPLHRNKIQMDRILKLIRKTDPDYFKAGSE